MLSENGNVFFEGFHMLALTDEQEIDFGQTLAKLRKLKGFTQVQLGEKIGVSQRVITYYERETTRPASHLISKICSALDINPEELLGLEPINYEDSLQNKNLWKKLRKVDDLPTKDKKALLQILDSLLEKNNL
jgi:transcriptional regulator with XRE-family HTH domain